MSPIVPPMVAAISAALSTAVPTAIPSATLPATGWVGSEAVVIPGTSGFMSVTPLGPDLLGTRWGGTAFVRLALDGTAEVLYALEGGPFESLSPASVHDGLIAFAGRGREGAAILVLDGAGRQVDRLGPYAECGNPAWDGAGALYFTADGMLLRDGEVLPFEAEGPVTPSPSGALAALAAPGGGVIVLDLPASTADTVAREATVTGMSWAGDARLLLACSDGQVLLCRTGRRVASRVITGEGVSWSDLLDGFLTSRMTDDGHFVTSSTVVFCNLGGGWAELDCPEGSMPSHPCSFGAGAAAIDAGSGSVLLLPFDRSAALTKRGGGRS
jgi:hypothetical protein